MRKPRVLVACEYSGTVRDAFARRGWDAWSCDLLETENPEGQHYTGDVNDIIGQDWDLVIAHPPCTFLTNSGVRWLYDSRPKFANRWQELDEGAEFFRSFLDLEHVEFIAVENPQMHKHAIERIGGVKPTQYIQPWEYGHGETKKTGLWLKNLPPLVPTDIVDGREARVHRMPPGPDRWKERSRFFRGVAEAMADQWGSYVLARTDLSEAA